MSWQADLTAEPWRFDFFTVLRRLERAHPDKPRIGDSNVRREEFALLGQNPYLDFPASNLEAADIDAQGRYHLTLRFLGLLGPQGALPLSTTNEALNWLHMRDDAFARFLDILNHRFLQLFFRAWADSRPIAQHERPDADRFFAYVGSTVGLGSPIYEDLDRVPDAQKLAHAGLAAPAAKSGVRLEGMIRGILGLEAEVYEFEGSRLPLAREDLTRLGRANFKLGTDAMVGSTFFSVQDKFKIRLRTRDYRQFTRVLPSGDYAEPLADLVFFYMGEELDWDVEIAIPAREVKPIRLGQSGALGWTSWLAPKIDPNDTSERIDTRFNLAERMRSKRAGAEMAQASS